MQIDIAQLEAHRAALTGHCYRMLGSPYDAEDAVQETMIRAWQNLARFEGRSSLRTWLYRIATNVCLDALSSRSRRIRPFEERPVGSVDDPLETRPATDWLEPIPDALVLPSDTDPFEQAALRQSVRLAFVAALQHLPPRQRAALLLADVLGWSAAEIAGGLDMTVAAVNSALQRARATLASRGAFERDEPLSESDTTLLERYVDAFHRYDVDGLVALMREDATLSMPPYTLWLRGPEAIRAWLLGRGIGCRGSRLLPTAACGLPAFGQFRCNPDGGYYPWSLTVLELSGGRISRWNAFLDTGRLFALFGLPPSLPEAPSSGPAEAGRHVPGDRRHVPRDRGVRL
ncbi:MAG: sigma-70 family RNA polymerase sigma factor [Acidobacteria bacterium]|nr:sigma-70 family RNA polymerase sigma factor [Acidobacteriota bacterium]